MIDGSELPKEPFIGPEKFENEENEEKSMNQLQVRIQVEPMHGKYSKGISAPFYISFSFWKNITLLSVLTYS